MRTIWSIRRLYARKQSPFISLHLEKSFTQAVALQGAFTVFHNISRRINDIPDATRAKKTRRKFLPRDFLSPTYNRNRLYS